MGLARIQAVFAKAEQDDDSDKPLLNIYVTAGYPDLDSTQRLLVAIDEAGADLIELGLPYSDPLADGPTIQESSSQALRNGITLDRIFEQVAEVRPKVAAAIIAMGYYNQVLQYGTDRFLERCKSVGIDGLILPDLPLDVYKTELEANLQKHDLGFSFLVTPRTSDVRTRALDAASRGWLYVVSSSSTTGNQAQDISAQQAYFERLQGLQLTKPRLIGFNIRDAASLAFAGQHAEGGIIGSAFIRAIDEQDVVGSATRFIESLR